MSLIVLSLILKRYRDTGKNIKEKILHWLMNVVEERKYQITIRLIVGEKLKDGNRTKQDIPEDSDKVS